MKNTSKIILVSLVSTLLWSAICSKQELKFLDDSNTIIADGSLGHQSQGTVALSQNLALFLQDNLKQGEIKIELNCSDSPVISNLKAKANPPTIIKGQSANIKIQGQASVAVKVAKLRIVCELNGDKVLDQKVDKSADLAKDQLFVYDYDASVPTFVPEGKFAVKLYLIDENDKEASCLAASFDF